MGRIGWINALLGVLALVLAAALVVVLADDDRRPAGGSAAAMLGRAVTDWGDAAPTKLSAPHRAAAAAAREEVLAVLTLDHEDVAGHVERVLEGATGRFAAEYADNEAALTERVTRDRSRSVGQVVALGVGDLDADRAVVLVAASSDVLDDSDESADEPRRRYHRFRLTHVREQDRWLVSDLDVVR